MRSTGDCSSRPVAQGYGTACLARKRMAFAISLLLAALYLGVVLCTVTAAASAHPDLPSALHVDICGDILGGIWTAAESPYYVTCDSSLPQGAILVIEHGVEIRFSAGVGLTISGTLSAIGTPDQPITFTSALAEAAPGDWNGLQFVADSSESQLSWCLVEYATTGVRVYAGPWETVGPTFSDCTVRHNSSYGILIEGFTRACGEGLAQPTITRCTIEDNGGYGIHGYGHGDPDEPCSQTRAGSVGGAVSGSVIRRNQGPGICLEARVDDMGRGDVWIAIEANVISGNAGDGVYLEDNDTIATDGYDLVHPRIENNLIYANAGAGLLSDAKHEDTDLLVVNNTVAGNTGDGVVFNRPAAQVRLVNNIISENGCYGLVCKGAPPTQAANNDLWGNASGQYDGCPSGIDDISADPLFVDREAGDYRLAFDSPCIDAGTTEGAPVTDIEGNDRPQGEGVDIGAYELWCRWVYLPVVLCE